VTRIFLCFLRKNLKKKEKKRVELAERLCILARYLILIKIPIPA